MFLSALRADGKGSHLNALHKAIQTNVWIRYLNDFYQVGNVNLPFFLSQLDFKFAANSFGKFCEGGNGWGISFHFLTFL